MNGAGLVATDIDASNGVIHVIDAVILPAAAPEKKGAHVAPVPATQVTSSCQHSAVQHVQVAPQQHAPVHQVFARRTVFRRR